MATCRVVSVLTRLLQLGLIVLTVLLILPSPALGGSANDPEILSRPDTSAQLRGQVIPHLEITKGWIQAQEKDGEDRFRFVLELASLPPVEDIPKDAVYTFHYTITELGRLYFRANWSADKTEFEMFGGAYAGCRPELCPPYDDQGNRNYYYMPGNESQHEWLDAEVIPGAPGRIAWSFPQTAYAEKERLNGLEMKGLFAATYTFTDNNALRYADITLSVKDFQHKVSTAWHERLFAQVPGVSPVVVTAGVLGAVALVGNRLRREEDE